MRFEGRTPNVGVWTGAAAGAVAILTVLEFLIQRFFVGRRPPGQDGAALTEWTARTSNGTLAVIVVDTFLMAVLIVFYACFRQLITQTRRDLDWIAALAYGSGLVFVAITVVGDAMEGGSALIAVSGDPDPSAIRALTDGHALLFGSIGCVLTALVSAASGYATLVSGALPRWTAAVAGVVAALNIMIAIATVFGGTDDSWNSIGGWGTALFATFPWLVWVVIVGIVVIRARRQHLESAKAIATV